MQDWIEFDELSLELRSQKCAPDVETLVRIGEWKSYGRNRYLFKGNRKNEVIGITSAAFKTIEEPNKEEASWKAMELLAWSDKKLRGVGIPMVSLLISMYEPRNFAVIDRYVWNLLFPRKKLLEGGSISNKQQWFDFISEVRKLADNNDMSCRDIEAALWLKWSYSETSQP